MTDRSNGEVTQVPGRDVDLPSTDEYPQGAASPSDNVQQSRGAAGNPMEFPRGTKFPEAIEAGRRVDRFELVRKLGKGGFGEVWACKDPQLDRSVAIKFAKPQKNNSYNADDMLAEARKVSRLSHPNIVQIFDVLQDGSQIAIVSELIDGPTLKHRLEQGPIPIREVLSIIRDVAAGLQCAHQSNLVHRDVKPSNILLRSTGTALLTDFGLAASEVQLGEMANGTSGTLRFMSPEQARGDLLLLDNRTDIFCLGIVLFHCLTDGKFPYPESKNDAKYLETVTRRPPRTLRAVNGSLPRALDDICSRCLSMDPRDRYRSAQDLIDDLDAFLAAGLSTADSPVAQSERSRIYFAVPTVLIAVAAFILWPRTTTNLSSVSSTTPEITSDSSNLLDLRKAPTTVSWPFDGRRGDSEHFADIRTWRFESESSEHLALCGSTDAATLDLQVEFSLDDAIGTAGIFWGWEQDLKALAVPTHTCYVAYYEKQSGETHGTINVSKLFLQSLDAQEKRIIREEMIDKVDVAEPIDAFTSIGVKIGRGSVTVLYLNKPVLSPKNLLHPGEVWLPSGSTGVGLIGRGKRVTFRSIQ